MLYHHYGALKAASKYPPIYPARAGAVFPDRIEAHEPLFIKHAKSPTQLESCLASNAVAAVQVTRTNVEL